MKFSIVALFTAVTLVSAAPMDLKTNAIEAYLEAAKFPSFKLPGKSSSSDGGSDGGLGSLLGLLKPKGSGGGGFGSLISELGLSASDLKDLGSIAGELQKESSDDSSSSSSDDS